MLQDVVTINEELERQGFGERGARMEVLAKGHPLGCDCAVCS